MSMIGEYIRVTSVELGRAIKDPAWALDFVAATEDVEDERHDLPTGEARRFTTYKTWDLLRFLLRRAAFPVDIIHGEEPFADDDDWGYGPPRYLPDDRVQVAATSLRRMSYAELLVGVDPAELVQDEVYPLGWDSHQSLEWGRDFFDGLKEYFDAAARDGDSMILWLD